MFTIELLRGDSLAVADIAERVISPRHLVYDAEHRAKVLLLERKQNAAEDALRGYRILDDKGRLVVQFWR